PVKAPMTARPAVSIIIPFYNLSSYLPHTLDSVRRQTYRDFEVILIDDGSTETEAAALLSRVEQGELGPVCVIRKVNGGLSAARTSGLAAARGRWVVPLDADDLLEPTFLESVVAAAARDPGLGLVTSLVVYFREHEPASRGVWAPLGI